MNLPVKQENGAELTLGTGSLELVRANLRKQIFSDPSLGWRVRRRILRELDGLITSERERRQRHAQYEREQEELNHRISIVMQQADAESAIRTRLAKARSEIAKYDMERDTYRLNIAERALQLRAKYKLHNERDDMSSELTRIQKRQLLSDAKEKAVLRGITKRAMNRAAFVKEAQEKHPDIADELIDYYDQQVFQQNRR